MIRTRFSSDVRRGVRQLRSSSGFWLAVLVALAVGAAVTAGALDFVQKGLAAPAAVDSPEGLPIPPPHVQVVSADVEPGEPRDTRFWGGTRASASRSPATIAEVQQRDLEVILLSLGGATVILLLVTIGNLALLLVSRGAARKPEVAIRAMMGGRRLRLMVQLLTEQIPLLVLGSVLAAALTALLRAAVRSTWPDGLVPWLSGPPAAEVVALALGLPLLIVAFCSILPALLLNESALREAAGAGTRITPGAGEGLLRRRMTVFGVASAVTLLVAAGLLFRGFATGAAAAAIPYDPRDTLTFVVRPAAPDLSPEEAIALQSEVLSTVESLAGIDSVALLSEGALLGLGSSASVHSMTGVPKRPGITGQARYVSLSPGALEVLRASYAGREFGMTDAAESRAVAVVNRTFANRYFFGDPIGRLVQLGRTAIDPTLFTVIGVYDDFRPLGIGNAEQPEPSIALSSLQVPPVSFDLVARHRGDPEVIRERIERALATSAPDAIISYEGALEARLVAFRSPLGWLGGLFGALSIVAALLAAYGLYGLITYNVRRRTREIGIRIALGAPPTWVVRELMRQGLRTSAAGLLLGLAGALCVGRLLQFTFSGIRIVDPLVHIPVLLLTAVVATVASYLPARSAARIDPVIALSHD